MSHHMNRDEHRGVHDAHRQANGMHSSRLIKVKVPLADLHGAEHEGVMRTHALPPHRAREAGLEMTIEVCIQCGFVEHVICHHGMSIWTHRPGCPRYTNEFDLPIGLIRGHREMITEQPSTDCSGCLLLCPICKNDGT